MSGTLINLDYDAAHEYVDRMGKNVTWNGWTIEVHRPNPRGFVSPDGVYRNGRWGFLTRIAPDANGTWRVREYSKPTRRRSR